jgi:hypothetical protein
LTQKINNKQRNQKCYSKELLLRIKTQNSHLVGNHRIVKQQPNKLRAYKKQTKTRGKQRARRLERDPRHSI